MVIDRSGAKYHQSLALLERSTNMCEAKRGSKGAQTCTLCVTPPPDDALIKLPMTSVSALAAHQNTCPRSPPTNEPPHMAYAHCNHPPNTPRPPDRPTHQLIIDHPTARSRNPIQIAKRIDQLIKLCHPHDSPITITYPRPPSSLVVPACSAAGRQGTRDY